MKKRTGYMLAAGCLIALSLTACQGKQSEAETAWKAAKSRDLVEYAKENESKLDMDKLKSEADSADSSLSQQFKATALLCAAEYEKGMSTDTAEVSDTASGTTSGTAAGTDTAKSSSTVSQDALYQFDYPMSASYAQQFLAKVNTDGEQFWEALKEAAYPYDSFDLLFAASDIPDNTTLINLLKNVPSDSSYADGWKESIGRWVKDRPVNVTRTGDGLVEAGFYDDWRWDQYVSAYFQSYNSNAPIKAKNADEAIQYVSYLKSSMLPYMETKFGKEQMQQQFEHPSQLVKDESRLSTGLTVTVNEPLTLKKAEDSTQPDTIDIDGKKVAAFYHNTQTEEYKDSPPNFLLLGDFLMNLPDTERPGSLQDTDYYLVLTPNYQDGDYYQSESGSPTKIKEVYSSTSLDLYDAKTGDLLRHLGNVMEQASTKILAHYGEESSRYPALYNEENLAFIYHNINNPDAYSSLLDHTTGQSGDLSAGEPVTLGNWEITFTSNTIAKSFQESVYSFEASEGNQFVRGNFTIKNIGNEKSSFFSTMGLTSNDVVVQITDSSHKASYLCSPAPQDKKCLNNAYLAPGESKEGELLFEVQDQVIQSGEPLYFELSLGKQKVYYPVSQ